MIAEEPPELRRVAAGKMRQRRCSCPTVPESSVSGMKMVETTVSTFITSLSRLLTFVSGRRGCR